MRKGVIDCAFKLEGWHFEKVDCLIDEKVDAREGSNLRRLNQIPE